MSFILRRWRYHLYGLSLISFTLLIYSLMVVDQNARNLNDSQLRGKFKRLRSTGDFNAQSAVQKDGLIRNEQERESAGNSNLQYGIQTTFKDSSKSNGGDSNLLRTFAANNKYRGTENFDTRRRVIVEKKPPPDPEADNAQIYASIFEHSNIFWDDDLENALGEKTIESLDDRCSKFDVIIDTTAILDMNASHWDRCGREGNAYGVFAQNAGSFCVRYRHPHDQFVAGEYLSFHFARMLGFQTVPCVRLSNTGSIDDGSQKQSHQWPVDISLLNWKENKPLVFIEWVPGLRGNLQIPSQLLNALRLNRAITKESLRNASMDDRLLLAQWTDLIVFDYLNGHHDRFARLQDDSEKERRPDVLVSSVPNLGLDPSGRLWFYDNEPGLLDAYSLMYSSGGESRDTSGAPTMGTSESRRFRKYHAQMMNTTCIFRRETLRNVMKMLEWTARDPLGPFRKAIEEAHPRFGDEEGAKKIWDERSRWMRYLRKYFPRRLRDVMEHARLCVLR